MAIKKLSLTKEHIKLISALRLLKLEIINEKTDLQKPTKSLMKLLDEIKIDNPNIEVCKQIATELMEISRAARQTEIDNGDKYYGINIYDPFLQGGSVEDTYDWISKLIGHYVDGEFVVNFDDGFDTEVTEEDITKYDELMEFILENFVDIEDLVHQRIAKGGITADATYYSDENVGIWYDEEEAKTRFPYLDF